MKNKKYSQQQFSGQELVPQTTAVFTSRVSKSYVPFTCKFPMGMHFVLILHRRCRSQTNFYVFSYDKISLKFCASFRFFHAVFMEKFPKIHYLSYVRRGIASIYALLLCRGHSWRVQLAKQETLTAPGHLVSSMVCRGPLMSTVVLYCCCHSDRSSVLLYFI